MSQKWHTYKVRRTLLPKQNGTKKLSTRYGDRLVCVRYRYDPEQQRTITTIEIVVAERPWKPDTQRIHSTKRLSLRVKFGEKEVGKAIRAAGGTWDSQG